MDREKVISHLDDLRQFADVEVHPVVSPEYLDIYATLCDYIDQIKEEVEALLKEQKAKIEQLNRFVNGFSREAVPVVRCKDCKYYDYFNGCMSWHDVNSNNDNWYCADGERKEGR